jgi:hypothetical protein
VNHIIERALEATPEEHREAVYQHVRPVAEQACAAFLPEQNDSTRWIQSLATQPTPLLDVENDGLEEISEAAPRECADVSGRQTDPLPPDGGIMSPKMHSETEARASEAVVPEATPSETVTLEPVLLKIEANETAAATSSPKRLTRREAKALHIQARDEARRARRQASRAKRKGRDAA